MIEDGAYQGRFFTGGCHYDKSAATTGSGVPVARPNISFNIKNKVLY